MRKKTARITHIQTSSERATGDAGSTYSELVEELNARNRAAVAKDEKEARERGDKVYGPGAPDGMSPRRFWQR